MTSYLIKARFKSGAKIDFRNYTKEFDNAVKKFNTHSQKIGKNSKLTIKSLNQHDFELILESPVQLTQPSKSLAKFSQALLQEEKIKYYRVGENQLLRCIETSLYTTPRTVLTDGQLLIAIVNLIHNTDCCTDSNELSKRKDLLKDLKKIIKTSGLDLI